MAGAFAKTRNAKSKRRPDFNSATPPDNAESEIFSDSRRFFHDLFLEKVILYGEVTIKSRWLEAKPLKFSPPKSLCGTVGSPWVSLATLFGFWETLIKFSESMILYDKKSFFSLKPPSLGSCQLATGALPRGCVATRRSPVDLRPATDSSRRELSETEAFHVGRVTGSNFIAR